MDLGPKGHQVAPCVLLSEFNSPKRNKLQQHLLCSHSDLCREGGKYFCAREAAAASTAYEESLSENTAVLDTLTS